MKDILVLFLKLVAGWLVLTIVFALIFEPVWQVPVGATLLIAGRFALRLVLEFYNPKLDTTWETVTALKCPDDVVSGTIERMSKGEVGSGYSYIGCVRRNYADKVYQKKKEFNSLREAELWLETTYDEALCQHYREGDS
ncbi:MAG: hypothetical protein HF973_16555 [Chloroflexi bacterium]|nr:hypothetical protein [Chloroflexota bacterium]